MPNKKWPNRICPLCGNAIESYTLLWRVIRLNADGKLEHIKAFCEYLNRRKELDGK